MKNHKRVEKEITLTEMGKLIKGIEQSIEQLAMATAKGFEQQSTEIEELRSDITTFKDETRERFDDVDENIGKVRKDIFNLDDRFMTRSDFKLKLSRQ